MDVSNTEIYKKEPKDLPASSSSIEVPQTTTGSASDSDGETVATTGKQSHPARGETSWSLSVTPKYDGLYISKSHDSVWTHMSVCVVDVTDASQKENVRIVTDERHNNFVYPFVTKGHKYKVYFTGQDADWDNWRGFYDVTVEAVGGLGDYNVSYNTWSYDSPSYSITLNGLAYTRPSLNVSTRVDASICDDGEWKGNRIYPGNIPIENSTFGLGAASSFLYQKDRLFIVLTLKFTYDENDYEYTIFENDNNTLITDTH